MGPFVDIRRVQSWSTRLLRDLFCSMAHHDGKATQIRHSVSLVVSLVIVFITFWHGSCSADLRQPTLSARWPAAGIRRISCTTRWEEFHI
jgi:hypothetical protein